MSASEDKRPMTVSEAAKYLGVSVGTVYKFTSRREIPFYKPRGGRVYFLKTDLEEFIFRNRSAANYELNQKADRLLAGER
jgi:excisionase family DNA binding protein